MIKLKEGGGFKGGRERGRWNHGRDRWAGKRYGGDEGRRTIRGREGWVGERYERGNEGRINISGRGINISGREGGRETYIGGMGKGYI